VDPSSSGDSPNVRERKWDHQIRMMKSVIWCIISRDDMRYYEADTSCPKLSRMYTLCVTGNRPYPYIPMAPLWLYFTASSGYLHTPAGVQFFAMLTGSGGVKQIFPPQWKTSAICWRGFRNLRIGTFNGTGSYLWCSFFLGNDANPFVVLRHQVQSEVLWAPFLSVG
jgi:hypothetical protein